MDKMKHKTLLQHDMAVGLRSLILCPFITMSTRCLEDLNGVISDGVDTSFKGLRWLQPTYGCCSARLHFL